MNVFEIKFQSRHRVKTEDAVETTLTYVGKYDDLVRLQDTLQIGSVVTSADQCYGNLVSAALDQISPEIWQLTTLYRLSADGTEVVSPPPSQYGKKSCRLSGSMLSLPLSKESAPKYRTNWDHYLAAVPGAPLPAFWDTATDAVITDAENAKKYAWIKTPDACPTVKGERWTILKEPVKKGVTSKDVATYSISELVKCRSESAAGKLVANTLNQTGRPATTFSISGGNWKCDDAQVYWDGKAWVAALTWTKSGGNKPWDPDMYEN